MCKLMLIVNCIAVRKKKMRKNYVYFELKFEIFFFLFQKEKKKKRNKRG